MWSHLLALSIGLIVGTSAGIILAGLCAAAKAGDEHIERIQK